jgi:ribonucleoside-diphosphate reductase alpha chain
MGDNPIQYIGHVKMMGAVQPFLSGAISKTVNMPEDVTIEDVEQLHVEAWKQGLKAVAIYREGSKVGQPLSMMKKGGNAKNEIDEVKTEPESVETLNDKIIVRGAIRRPLPKVRAAKTFSFTVADSHGYVTVGEYEDGSPGEIFLNVAKMGSTLAGLMDSFARSVSYGLQYGVPLKTYVKGLSHMSFAPAGITDDPEIRTASSLMDYIFRRLALSYLPFDDRLELGLASIDDMPDEQTSLLVEEPEAQAIEEVKVEEPSPKSMAAPVETSSKVTSKPSVADAAAPMCYNCGNQTQKAGSCYVCTSCGSTTGCS